ncbi:hypothetical protein BTO06_16415 [Tenacibaculum sp. SZ-18]|uniref:O-antigen ligase family protein n=1 Tax=Tenacibaculum sp. SZ-18 TaxID=754423 RepID=UPI000C2CF2CB|nr:O-antigen ligase family protein [Tenacibaculum sp. SZ-18]AUC16632.1 hypothetical protein BTO06_16415 [Tenacibaculum sp. SZ-18]
MKKILKFIRNEEINIAFMLLFSLVLFPRNLKSIAIVLFALILIIKAITNKQKFNWKFFLINSSVYIFILLTVFYSQDMRYASLKLQTMLSLLLFPLLFSLISIDDYKNIYNNKNKFLYTYVLSVIGFNMSIFLWYCVKYANVFNAMRHYIIIVDQKLDKFSIHPIYLSMHIGIALVFCFYLFMKNNNKWILFLATILLFFLSILMKKGPILSLSIVLSYAVIFILNKKMKLRVLLLSLVGFTLLFSSSKLRNNFKELLNITPLTENNFTSTNMRAEIYKSSLKPMGQSLFLGHGIGDFNKVLINSYTNETLRKDKYNSHNQYISFVLIGGIVLLMLFLGVNFYNIKLAVKQKNHLFVVICVFYLANMLTESILERENGVVYFSFFTCFFGLKSYLSSNEV